MALWRAHLCVLVHCSVHDLNIFYFCLNYIITLFKHKSDTVAQVTHPSKCWLSFFCVHICSIGTFQSSGF